MFVSAARLKVYREFSTIVKAFLQAFDEDRARLQAVVDTSVGDKGQDVLRGMGAAPALVDASGKLTLFILENREAFE